MARLSRPYQIAIVAVLALFLAWFVLLRSHGSPTSASAPPGSAAANSAGGSTHSGNVAHATAGAGSTHGGGGGSAKAGAGSTHGGGNAHGAGGSHAKAGADPAGGSVATHSATAANPKAAADPAGAKGTHAASTGAGHGHAAADAHRSPAEVIASQLAAGRVVLLLFWNPHSADDAAVHSQLRAVAHAMGHRVAVHFAKAGEVGSFGTVTRDVNVNQTPTLLVIDKKGLVRTITGLTDAFAIEQAVREAGH